LRSSCVKDVCVIYMGLARTAVIAIAVKRANVCMYTLVLGNCGITLLCTLDFSQPVAPNGLLL